MLLGKEQLLQSPSLATQDVELPEFGGTLRIREWTGADNDAFGKAVDGIKFDGAMFAAAVAVSAVDDRGNRLFDMNGDLTRIASTWPKSALQRVWNAVQSMNRIGQQGLEDAEKN